jgi:hypothetical protein
VVAELWAANALWPGQAIAARLREQVSALRSVLLVDEFDATQTQPKQLPSAIVLLDQLRVDVRDIYTRPANCDQDWMVAIAVRSARSDADAESAQAGPLISKVVAALHGWKPDDTSRALVWRTGPRPNFGRDVSYYPLLFTLQGALASAP